MKSKLAVFILAILSFAAPVGCSYEITIDSDGDTVPDSEDACPNDRDLIQDEGECGCNYRKINGRCVYLESVEDSDKDGTPDIFKDSDEDGTPDLYDHCPNDPNKIEPGTCGCGTPDTDTDGDSTPDCIDKCPNDPNKTESGYCGCGQEETDTDGDTTPDCIDECPKDPANVFKDLCSCDDPNLDTDKDGTPDCIDACPKDPNKTTPGACGCNTADTDTDKDGQPDCNDQCPFDSNKIEPGTCGCHIPDMDQNKNGVTDCLEKCPSTTDSKQEYTGICGCRNVDIDHDQDGFVDGCKDDDPKITIFPDQCPDDPQKQAPGICGCGIPDTDTDLDGTPDCFDDCPNDPLNTDSDGDDTPDCIDECPEDPDKTEPGHCGCGTPETADSDGDDIHDCHDTCPYDSAKTEPGICGCGTPDTDIDLDGTPDCMDKCPDDPQKQACPCHLSGRNANVEITEDGETRRIQVCMEEGGLLQVGYMNKFQENTVNTHEDAVNAFNSRSISHQNIRLHYSPAGNLLSNPTLEHDNTGWEAKNYSRWYGLSYAEDCKYQSTSCLCRAFGKYPNLIASYSWRTTFKQTIQLSNTQCKDATECSHPLTVGMFAYALSNGGEQNDAIRISLMKATMTETVVPTETRFFTMTQTIHLSETSQNIEVTFSGNDTGFWLGDYGAALQYFAAWLGEREIRFSNDGLTWTPWQIFTPAEKGASDAWFVEWDLGTCDNNQEACTKTVYMQTHDLLTDRYYETSDSVQYIPEN